MWINRKIVRLWSWSLEHISNRNLIHMMVGHMLLALPEDGDLMRRSHLRLTEAPGIVLCPRRKTGTSAANWLPRRPRHSCGIQWQSTCPHARARERGLSVAYRSSITQFTPIAHRVPKILNNTSIFDSDSNRDDDAADSMCSLQLDCLFT